jgi:REP element-mobilizing transposase RayT
LAPYDKGIPHRRSVRLQGYDYSQNGAYFITVCVQNKEWRFGKIADGEMRMSALGEIVVTEWMKTTTARNGIALGVWVVMPNHFHGIIHLNDGILTMDKMDMIDSIPVERFGKPAVRSIPTIIRSFKSATTRQVNQLRRTPGVKLWQRGYYEHVIRDDGEYELVAEYIRSNPANWERDVLRGYDAEIRQRAIAARQDA